MTNTAALALVPTTVEGVATDAVTCGCGDLAHCYFCEPLAGLTDEQALDLFYSCYKCDALASEEHEEWCPIGRIVARWRAEEG